MTSVVTSLLHVQVVPAGLRKQLEGRLCPFILGTILKEEDVAMPAEVSFHIHTISCVDESAALLGYSR